MEYQNRITMSISDWVNYIDDDNIEFAFGKVDFLSNKPNSHRHIYSEEVIKEYAPTVLGKWVVADYDKYTSDATTHTLGEVIVGYVPVSQEVQYRYNAEGFLVASVDVIISKLYATNVYEMFKTKNYKSVSIEELVNFVEEDVSKIDGYEDKVIESFNICGITILGDKYNPSVPDANIQLTKMSNDEVNKELIESAYITYSEKHKDNSIDKIDIVLSKLESIERKINKEEIMLSTEEIKNSEEQVVENEAVETENAEQEVENAEEETVENACGEEEKESADEVDNACGEEVKNEEVEDKEDEEVKEKDDVEDEDNKEKEDAKMAELMSKLSEAESKIAEYEEELNSLRKFKQDAEYSEKMTICSQTLNKIKQFIDNVKYAEYEKQFEECSYEEVGALKNSILAQYVDEVIEMSQTGNKNEETEIVDYGIPVPSTKVDSIYD